MKRRGGGGGISDSVQVGNQTVTFGHGGRHLSGDIGAINQGIAEDIILRNLPFLKDVKYFDVTINGQTISYGAKRITETIVNIGTYYAK